MKYHLVLGFVVLLQLSGVFGSALRRAENKFVVIGPNDDPHENAHSIIRDDHDFSENYHENAENVVGDLNNYPEVQNDPEIVHNDLEVPNNDLEVPHNGLDVPHNDLDVPHNYPEVPHNDVEVQKNPEEDDEELTEEDIEEILMFIISQLLGDEDFDKFLKEYYQRKGVERNERAVEHHRYRKNIPHVRAKVVKHVHKYIASKEEGENGGLWNEEYDQNAYGKDYFNYIEARNIFGNSVGNDKVTNLYIFNYKDSVEESYEENDGQENYGQEYYGQENDGKEQNYELEDEEDYDKKNIVKGKVLVKKIK